MQRTVLTIFYKHQRGGHCKRLYMMIEALLARGYSVHYLAAEKLALPENPNLHAHLLSLPVKAREGFWFWFWFTILAPFAFIRLSIRRRAIAIAVFDTYYSLLAKPASLLTFTPITVLLRAVPWRVTAINARSELIRSTAYPIDYFGLRFAKRIVAVTSAMQAEIQTRIPALKGRVVVLPNSVIYPDALPVQSDETVSASDWKAWVDAFPARKRYVADGYELSEKNLILVTSGELNARKNIELVIRALGATQNEKIALIICGDGRERAKLNSIRVALGLTERVIFAGWLENPAEIVSGSDILVMPSLHEGMANSMLEALGAGVAVLAADTPEMHEVLQAEELLFHPEHVGELAERLDQLAGNRAEMDLIKKRSHERALHLTFNWGDRLVSLLTGKS